MTAPLHFISGQTAACSHPESIALACEAGVRWVQLRVKGQPEEEVFLQARDVKKICRQYGAKLIINDYPAIAKAIGADGVHLGKEDMPVTEARKIVGNMVIGATANTFDDILAHARSGADYVGLGPFRFTNTKKKLSPLLGLEGYKNMLAQCRLNGLQLPIIAIGGIELEDIAAILQTGVHGVAVSSLIAGAENRQEVVKNIYQTLQKISLRDA